MDSRCVRGFKDNRDKKAKGAGTANIYMKGNCEGGQNTPGL